MLHSETSSIGAGGARKIDLAVTHTTKAARYLLGLLDSGQLNGADTEVVGEALSTLGTTLMFIGRIGEAAREAD